MRLCVAHVGKRMKPQEVGEARFVEFWHNPGVQNVGGGHDPVSDHRFTQ
jgi:hypothetical protein